MRHVDLRAIGVYGQRAVLVALHLRHRARHPSAQDHQHDYDNGGDNVDKRAAIVIAFSSHLVFYGIFDSRIFIHPPARPHQPSLRGSAAWTKVDDSPGVDRRRWHGKPRGIHALHLATGIDRILTFTPCLPSMTSRKPMEIMILPVKDKRISLSFQHQT
jgi:hypothetical protein